MNPLVYIIILNWNGKDLTLECLTSLSKVMYDNYKILVVDNGSTDDSIQSIKSKFPDVELLELKHNKGYAAGNNAGFESVVGKCPEIVIFLNNDTLVDPLFIKPLIKPLQDNLDICQTVPKIYYADGKDKIWYAGGKVNLWFGLVYHKNIRKKDNESLNHSEYTDYATGCCFAMRCNDFVKFGGFDESFPMYGEDVDLSLRIRESGKKVLYVHNSHIWHKISASIGGEFSKNKFWKKLRGLAHLLKKHANFFQRISSVVFFIIFYLPVSFIRLIFYNIFPKKG